MEKLLFLASLTLQASATYLRIIKDDITLPNGKSYELNSFFNSIDVREDLVLINDVDRKE